MANDNRASFAKIGFIVFIGIAAIVATLIYLGNIRGQGRETIVETYYDKGVSGLAIGSAVNMRGVKIGEVRNISFIGSKYHVGRYDQARIYIEMAFSHKLLGLNDSNRIENEEKLRALFNDLVSHGLRATVTSSGITGLSRIEMDFYPPEKASAIEKISWHPRHIFIPPQISLLDSFSDSATKVMNQINKMDITAAWSNVAHSVESLAVAMDSAKVIMETHQADMQRIFDNLSEATRSIRDFSEELKRNPSLLIRDRRMTALPETER